MRIIFASLHDRHAVCDRKCLFNVQVTLASVLADPAVVIDTVGDIGILLNLCDQDAFSDRMKRTGLNKQCIAFMYFDRIQHFQQRIRTDALGELFFGDLLPEPVVQIRTRFRIQHIPHLRFPVLSFVLQGIAVRRMHLNAEIVFRIDELRQDGEFAESAAVCAEYFHAVFINELFQCSAGMQSFRNDRRSVRMTGQFPCLRQNVSVVFHIVFVFQTLQFQYCHMMIPQLLLFLYFTLCPALPSLSSAPETA